MRTLTFILSFMCITFFLNSYPIMQELNIRDALYIQQQSIVKQYLKEASTGEDIAVPLQIFAYKITENDLFQSVFSIAARTLIPYDTLASINGIPSSNIVITGQEILIPSLPGLFVPDTPTNELEILLHDRLKDRFSEASKVHIEQNGEEKSYYFFLGTKFSSAEQKMFFQSLFSFPLNEYNITSLYGWRNHPVTGLPNFHRGIDISAAKGSSVYASRTGRVAEIGYDATWGHYVLISHENNYESFYAHLDEVHCEEGELVNRKDPIATVGNSGISTGSHLHFEIRRYNKKINPLTLLPAVSSNIVRY